MKNIGLMNIPLRTHSVMRRFSNAFSLLTLFLKTLFSFTNTTYWKPVQALCLGLVMLGSIGLNDAFGQTAVPQANGDIIVTLPASCSINASNPVTARVRADDNNTGTLSGIILQTINVSSNQFTVTGIPTETIVEFQFLNSGGSSLICGSPAMIMQIESVLNRFLNFTAPTVRVTNAKCAVPGGSATFTFANGGNYKITYTDAAGNVFTPHTSTPPNPGTTCNTANNPNLGGRITVGGLAPNNGPYTFTVCRVEGGASSTPITLDPVTVGRDEDDLQLELYSECFGRIRNGDILVMHVQSQLAVDVEASQCASLGLIQTGAISAVAPGISFTYTPSSVNDINDTHNAFLPGDDDIIFNPDSPGTYNLSVTVDNDTMGIKPNKTVNFVVQVGELIKPEWTPNQCKIVQPSCSNKGSIQFDASDFYPLSTSNCAFGPITYNIDVLSGTGASIISGFSPNLDVTNANGVALGSLTVPNLEPDNYTVVVSYVQGTLRSQTCTFPISMSDVDVVAPVVTASVTNIMGSMNAGTMTALNNGNAITDGIVIMSDANPVTSGPLDLNTNVTPTTAIGGSIGIDFTLNDLGDLGKCAIKLDTVNIPAGITVSLLKGINFINELPNPNPFTAIINISGGILRQGVYPIQFVASDEAGNKTNFTIFLKVGNPALQIENPCSCNNNAVAGQPGTGTFSERITLVTPNPGEDWRVVSGTTGLINGATGIAPVNNFTRLTQAVTVGILNQHKYELTGLHTDGVGYTVVVQRFDATGNPIPGTQLTISNKCTYPRPAITGFTGTVCGGLTSASLGNVGTPTGGTFKIDGITVSNFDPSTLATGTHILEYTVNGTMTANAFNSNGSCKDLVNGCAAACAQSAVTSFSVLDIALAATGVDATCGAQDGSINMTATISGQPTGSTIEVDFFLLDTVTGQVAIQSASDLRPVLVAGTGTTVSHTFSGLAHDNYVVKAEIYSVDGTVIAPCISPNVTVAIGSGCTQPVCSGFSLFVNSTAETAMGANNGIVTVTPGGGSGTFTYQWVNANNTIVGNTATVNNLPPGTYTITVQDVNLAACIETQNVTVAAAGTTCGLTIAISTLTAETAAGANDGAVTATGVGMSGSYTYVWTSANGNVVGTTAALTSLTPGVYTVRVTDALTPTCFMTRDVSIAAAATSSCGLTVAAPSIMQATTATATDGGATAMGAGASGSYTYVWTDANGAVISTSATISGVAAGDYTVRVTDALSPACFVSNTVTISTVTLTRSPVQFLVGAISGSQGDIVQVPVRVVGFENITSFDMSFNLPNAADARFVTPNPIRNPAVTGISSGPNTTSRVNLIWINSVGQTLADSTVLFTVDMELLAGAGTAVPITIDGNLNPNVEVVGIINGSPVDLTVLTRNGETMVTTAPGLALGGSIYLPDGSTAVTNANVNLMSGTTTSTTTNTTGDFGFTVQGGNSYTITPFEDTNYNGGGMVDLVDIQEIQAHIVRNNPLDSHYELIAADADRNGIIESRDLSHIIRAALLNVPFPNNTSWRFIPTDHSPFPAFGDYVNPVTNYPESRSVTNISQATINQDFIGIKIGDVASSFATSPFRATSSSRSAFQFVVKDQLLQAGALIAVPVKANNFRDIVGYQMTLGTNNALSLENVVPAAIKDISLENFGQSETEDLATLWVSAVPTTVDADATLFTLYFRVATGGQYLRDVLNINSDQIPAYGLKGDYTDTGISLVFEEATIEPAGVFELYQNRPNPFRGATTVSFNLPKRGIATLTVFDMAGRSVHQVAGEYAKGYNEVRINSTDLATSGVLYYELEMAGQTTKRKMIAIE